MTHERESEEGSLQSACCGLTHLLLHVCTYTHVCTYAQVHTHRIWGF